MKRTNNNNSLHRSYSPTPSLNRIALSTTTQISDSPRHSEKQLAILNNAVDTNLNNRSIDHSNNANSTDFTKSQTTSKSNTSFIINFKASSPFYDANFIHYITQYLSYKNILNLLSINKSARLVLNEFDRFQVLLAHSPCEISHPLNEKIQFIQINKLPIKIRVTNCDELLDLLQFIDNLNNQHLLNHIEALELGSINENNVEDTQNFLNLLATKADQLLNLKSFSCDDIYGIDNSDEEENYADITLTIPDLLKFNSFTCGDIHGNIHLNLSQSVLTFICKDIAPNSSLSFPAELNLASFSCGHIGEDSNVLLSEDLHNLCTFSCGDLDDDATLDFSKKLNSLISLRCGDLAPRVELNLPLELNNLEQLIFGEINIHLTFPQLNKLKFFSCEDIYSHTRLSFPKTLNSLISLSFGYIDYVTYIQLPEELASLTSLYYVQAMDLDTDKKLKELQLSIKSKRENQT